MQDIRSCFVFSVQTTCLVWQSLGCKQSCSLDAKYLLMTLDTTYQPDCERLKDVFFQPELGSHGTGTSWKEQSLAEPGLLELTSILTATNGRKLLLLLSKYLSPKLYRLLKRT